MHLLQCLKKKGVREQTQTVTDRQTIQGWYNYKHLRNSMLHDFNVSSMTPVAYTCIYYLDICFAVLYFVPKNIWWFSERRS